VPSSICERGRNNKDDFEDEGLNGNGIGVGQKSVAGEKSNVRHSDSNPINVERTIDVCR